MKIYWYNNYQNKVQTIFVDYAYGKRIICNDWKSNFFSQMFHYLSNKSKDIVWKAVFISYIKTKGHLLEASPKIPKKLRNPSSQTYKIPLPSFRPPVSKYVHESLHMAVTTIPAVAAQLLHSKSPNSSTIELSYLHHRPGLLSLQRHPRPSKPSSSLRRRKHSWRQHENIIVRSMCMLIHMFHV